MNISTSPITGKPRRRDLVACQNLYFRIGVEAWPIHTRLRRRGAGGERA